MLLLNAKLTPEEAYEYGLVAEVFPDSLFKEATSRLLKETAQLPMPVSYPVKPLPNSFPYYYL
jgi:enoyl-CoA hydratase/carnithine racemase